MDFTDPAHPVLRDFFDTPGYVQGMAVTDRHAFVADDEAGLIILDISNPAALRQVGHYPTRGPLTRIAVSGNLAYLGLEGGLVILDVTDPAKPIRVGIWSTSNPVRDLAVQGTTVFVLEAGKGLEILDVRQPGNPVLVGSHAWVMDAVALAVQGDFVFLANGARGLQVIDVSNPAKPEWVAGYATSGPAEDVAASGNHVWLAAGSARVAGVRVPRPTHQGRAAGWPWQGHHVLLAGGCRMAVAAHDQLGEGGLAGRSRLGNHKPNHGANRRRQRVLPIGETMKTPFERTVL